jgi:hypothetical protein
VPRPHPLLVYTALRLGLLVVVTALLALTGLRGAPLLLLALLVSGLISLVALRGNRGEISARLVERRRAERRQQRGDRASRIDAGARSEDDD